MTVVINLTLKINLNVKKSSEATILFRISIVQNLFLPILSQIQELKLILESRPKTFIQGLKSSFSDPRALRSTLKPQMMS